MLAWHRVGTLGVLLSVPLLWGCRCGSDAKVAREEHWDGGSLGGRSNGRGGEAGQDGGSGGTSATGGSGATAGSGATGGANPSGGSSGSHCVAAPPPSLAEGGHGGESGASGDNAPGGLLKHFKGLGHQQFLAGAYDPDTFDMVFGGRNSGVVSFGGEALESAGIDDVIVVKLDQSGRHIWSREFAGTAGGNEITAVALGRDGAVYATGHVDGAIDFGTGPLEKRSDRIREIFALALNADGSTRWATRYGPGTGWSVAVANDGDVVIAGDSGTADDFGSGVLPSFGREDVFVLRFDPDGALKTARKFGGPMLDTAHAVTVDSSGGVIVSGIQMGGIDFGDGPAPETDGGSFLVKFDALDNLVYAKVSSTPSLGALALEPLPDGGILAQYYESAARVDANGEEQWTTPIDSATLPRTIARGDTSAWFTLQVDPDPACEWTTGPILAELSLADGGVVSTRQVSVGPDSWLSLWAPGLAPNQVVVAGWLYGVGFDFGNGDIGPTDGANPIVVGYAR